MTDDLGRRPYQAAHLSDLTGDRGWAPIRRVFDVRAFGVNAWTARAVGAALVLPHDELSSGHEELYMVTAGAAGFTVSGERIDAPAGTLLFVRDPTVRREAIALEPDTTVVVVGGTAGQAFAPRSWETNAEVLPLFDDGQYAKARTLLTAALDRYDDHATLHYNLACAEARLGELDSALQHLAAALRERPTLAADAHADPDLDPIRGDPRFAVLVPEVPED